MTGVPVKRSSDGSVHVSEDLLRLAAMVPGLFGAGGVYNRGQARSDKLKAARDANAVKASAWTVRLWCIRFQCTHPTAAPCYGDRFESLYSYRGREPRAPHCKTLVAAFQHGLGAGWRDVAAVFAGRPGAR